MRIADSLRGAQDFAQSQHMCDGDLDACPENRRCTAASLIKLLLSVFLHLDAQILVNCESTVFITRSG